MPNFLVSVLMLWNIFIPESGAVCVFTVLRDVFVGKVDLNFRKKIVKYYIWNVAWCGAETRTLLKIYNKSFKVLKCSAGGQLVRSHKK